MSFDDLFLKQRNEFFASKFSRSLKFLNDYFQKASDIDLENGSHYALVINLDSDVVYHFMVLNELCSHLDGGTVSIKISEN